MAGRGGRRPRRSTPSPHAATVEGGAIVLTSPVDPAYGMRVRRRIALHPTTPMMSIETTYEKVQGAPVRVAVWTITQLASPRVMIGGCCPSGRRSRADFAACCPRRRRTCQCTAGLLTIERDTEAEDDDRDRR